MEIFEEIPPGHLHAERDLRVNIVVDTAVKVHVAGNDHIWKMS